MVDAVVPGPIGHHTRAGRALGVGRCGSGVLSGYVGGLHGVERGWATWCGVGGDDGGFYVARDGQGGGVNFN